MMFNAKNLVGSVVAGYQLEYVVGTGGAGTVFRAHPVEHPDQPVAIKVLMPPTMDEQAQEDFRKRFMREAETLQALQHPRILPVQALGTDEDTGLMYMVMPYISGGTLADRLAHDPLSLPKTLAYIQQLADALDYAHAHQVIHRDLKPANVLLDDQDHVYLADFGIAKLLDNDATTLTNINQVIGTPGYMAPEQVTGDAISPATDIYGLGILAYQMVTGRIPFEAPSLVAALRQITLETPTSPCDFRADLPIPAGEAILRALAKEPAQRYPSVMAFAHALERGLQDKYMTPSPQSIIVQLGPLDDAALHPDAVPAAWVMDSRPKRRRNPRRGLIVAAGLLTICLLGTAGILIAGQHPSVKMTAALLTATSTTQGSTSTLSSGSGKGGGTTNPGGSPAPGSSTASGSTPTPGKTSPGSTPVPGKTAPPGEPTSTPPPGSTPKPVPTATPTPIPPGELSSNLTNVTLPDTGAAVFFCSQFGSASPTLTNVGGQTLSWTSSTSAPVNIPPPINGQAYVNLSPTSGTLAPGQSITVQATGFDVPNTTLTASFFANGLRLNEFISCAPG
jgi:serine/threonine protein kinase